MRPLQRLLVTRPDAEANTWAAALQERGWPAVALPLIAIGPPQDASALAQLNQARAAWSGFDAILFVSAAAVRYFFETGVQARPEAKTRFWAPGPGTAHHLELALQALGLGPDRIDAPAAEAEQFDSEHLWPVVSSQLRTGSRVLVVRGDSQADEHAAVGPERANRHAGRGRDWLLQRCEAAGAQVFTCVAYERRVPLWTARQRALAEAAGGPGSVWLFSSSEAVAHLCRLVAASDWSGATALVTHPRIGAKAEAAGFGHVVKTRPALADVVRALESGWSPV